MTMLLEAISRGCFSRDYLLQLDGRAIGELSTRMMSEGVDIRLTGQRRLRLERRGFFVGSVELIDEAAGEVIASGKPAGMFSSAWDLTLSVGPARMKRGWFGEAPVLVESVGEVAWVSRRGWCASGWKVRAEEGLELTDLLLIGLAHHTIERREEAAAASTTSVG